MDKPPTWVFRNVARRPVELHRPSGVVVLPPFGTITVDGPDPQCLALERRGVLTRHAVPPPAAEPAAPESAAEPAGAAPAPAEPDTEAAGTGTAEAAPSGEEGRETTTESAPQIDPSKSAPAARKARVRRGEGE